MNKRPPAPLKQLISPVSENLSTQLRGIYQDAEKELRTFHLACDACGQCCDLASFGHEMWLTQLELSLLISDHGLRRPETGSRCPYLESDKCTARTGRPLGCRIFFCRADAAILEPTYEKYLEQLRVAGKKMGLEVRYGELIASLRFFS